MAKISGPIASAMRGKVGQVVAAKTVGGDTALRSYQPVVKNPNTLRQQVSRAKMAAASSLAATLSVGIKIGYAKAVAGEKMYARNMFVGNIVPVSKGVMTNDGTNITTDLTKLPISEAAGISEIPTIVVGAGTEAGSKKIDVSNVGSIVLEGGETLGLVVVALSADSKSSIVRQGVATTGVTLSAAEVAAIGEGHYYAFVKAIPVAKNGVVSTVEPWMYPSVTSATVPFVLG